jgi:hypothetical protein
MDRLELQIAVDAGLSIAQLAERFDCSKGSVRYWLSKYGLRTRNRARRHSSPGVLEARAAGLAVARLTCPTHGVTEFVIDVNGTYRCRACRVSDVVNRRRKMKRTLVAEAGGCCQLCGYDRFQGALAFHHLDPETKARTIANRGITVSIQTLRAEAHKCVLLCHNCHAEVEGGVSQVSSLH